MKKFYIILAVAMANCTLSAQTLSTADFENLNYTDGLDYENGSNLNGGFKSGNFYFVNTSTLADYGEWGTFFTMGGFCYSKRTETTYTSMTYETDQFNNQVGAGADGSEGFALVYGTSPSVLQADYTFKPQSCYVTNNAYLLNSVMNGDAYARRFNYDDRYTLTITGYKDKVPTAEVTVELAAKGSVVFQWIPVDLSPLGEVDQVTFSVNSTDSGEWGMNTPAYFCLDNFTAEITDTPTVMSHITARQQADSRQLYDLLGREVKVPQAGKFYVK